jgi:flavin-dependent dehydrogenase
VLEEPAGAYDAGCIYMACDAAGYVGLVRLEDGRLDLAAALDPVALRKFGDPARLVHRVLEHCGLTIPSRLRETHWKGTCRLTRRPASVAEHRLLRIGDAAGYVEPFTGEGIAWALWSGIASARIASAWLADGGARELDASERNADELSRAWRREHARLLGRGHWVCRATTLALRNPLLLQSAAGLLRVAPWMAQPFLHHLNRAPANVPPGGGAVAEPPVPIGGE